MANRHPDIPKEFDFKTNVNPHGYGIIYHARRSDKKDEYFITWEKTGEAKYTGAAMRQFIAKKEFSIIASADTMKQ